MVNAFATPKQHRTKNERSQNNSLTLTEQLLWNRDFFMHTFSVNKVLLTDSRLSKKQWKQKGERVFEWMGHLNNALPTSQLRNGSEDWPLWNIIVDEVTVILQLSQSLQANHIVQTCIFSYTTDVCITTCKIVYKEVSINLNLAQSGLSLAADGIFRRPRMDHCNHSGTLSLRRQKCWSVFPLKGHSFKASTRTSSITDTSATSTKRRQSNAAIGDISSEVTENVREFLKSHCAWQTESPEISQLIPSSSTQVSRQL